MYKYLIYNCSVYVVIQRLDIEIGIKLFRCDGRKTAKKLYNRINHIIMSGVVHMAKMDLMLGVLSRVLGDFVTKVVSDSVDVLKSAIKDADLNRKSRNQNLQAQLYLTIVDALNAYTYNKYKNQEHLYDAAESILKVFMCSKDDTYDLKIGLKVLVSGVDDDACKEFLEIFYHEICKSEHRNLYNEIDMLWKKREREYDYTEFGESSQSVRELLNKLSDLENCVEYIKEKGDDEKKDVVRYENAIDVINRAEEYADKWNSNMFLNDFNQRDENAGVNVKLKEIYLEKCLPHYIWESNEKASSDLKELISEYVISNTDKKMLLILGQAGIGKSTLITWIIANLIKSEEQILVYQFASDLNNVNWLSDNIINEILKTLNLKDADLENKILILDGFDEIQASNDREKILNQLQYELNRMNNLERFSLIITCRENYVYRMQNIVCDHITLQAWDSGQIRSFCENYGRLSLGEVNSDTINRIIDNKEILGIPLILYMLMAFKIEINRNDSIMDVYDRIFSLDEGGIYNRCVKDQSYAPIHRISVIKQQIYQVSQQIAFWIFENNSEYAFIPEEVYGNICDIVMSKSEDRSENIKQDILLGNYFGLIQYCDGIERNELHFLHYSIYEYFVAVYFFESIYNLTSKEAVAGKLGFLLKRGCLSQQILAFIKHKFDNFKRNEFPNILRDSFEMMIQNGMTYYANESFLNVIDCEINVFSNMLEIMHLWNFTQREFNNKIVLYFRYNNRSTFNLTGFKLKKVDLREISLAKSNLREADLREANLGEVDLREANLREANLRKACLNGAYLRKANLIGTNLIGANLSRADLSRANLIEATLVNTDLIGADLIETDLIRADLSGANLFRTNLSGADLREAKINETDFVNVNLKETIFDEEQARWLSDKCDLSGSRVYLSEEEEIISYEEYCIKNRQV